MEQINTTIDPKKCYSCGKIFKLVTDLQRHKNRKTPCLIKTIPIDQINNPNRCLHCNRIFSNVGNLNKHLNLCKFANK